jgi:hypothetical protein
MKRVAVLIPIYRPGLDPLEKFSLDTSLACLRGRDTAFIGPADLDRSYYLEHYPGIPMIEFEAHYFESIAGYNRLLVSQGFYVRFLRYEFILILQTDAILLRDELDHWCWQPFDYVGAPWPDGHELFINVGRFEGAFGKRLKVHVGNGGLSLRRTRACLALLEEFTVAISVFDKTGSSEDLFFSFMGALSGDFVIPNQITASLFSLELRPAYYIEVNGGRLPMGGHAWWKHDPEFWRPLLPSLTADTLSELPPKFRLPRDGA